MPMTDAQRRANRKWDSANYTHLPCKIRKDRAAAFREACSANGDAPNAILNSAVNAYIDQHGGWDYWLQKVQDSPAEDQASPT